MLGLKLVSAAVIAVALLIVALVFGPIRWEVAHTYQHLISGVGDDLPSLTVSLGLPVLDVDGQGAGGVAVAGVIWGTAWIGPIVLLAGVWRIEHRARLIEWLVLGGLTYGVLMTLFSILVGFSLWLPFSLL